MRISGSDSALSASAFPAFAAAAAAGRVGRSVLHSACTAISQSIQTTMTHRLLLALVPFSFSLHAAPGDAAADWPGYRGPNGDGTTALVAKPWKPEGPVVAWEAAMKDGFSSIAVADGIAATLTERDHEGTPSEFCVAMDAATGKELWAQPLLQAKYDGGGDDGERENKGGDGPRSTPAISGGKIYVYGSSLNLHCLDAKTGKELWSHDIVKDFDGKNIQWQNASSPLVEGGLVIVGGGGAGQAFLAFDAADGKLKWKGEDDTITHATPTPATIHGVRQVIFFTKSGLAAVEAKTGKLLWRQSYKFNISTAASPIVDGDIVYCAAGYGVGSAGFKIKKSGSTWESSELWRSEGDKMTNHWSTPVLYKGHLYGMFSFKKYGKGPLKCVDIRTGEEKWSMDGFGAGNVILAGDKVVALSDRGELVLVDASPSSYKELARADVLDGKCWSTPTLAAGHLFARSTTEAKCFKLGN